MFYVVDIRGRVIASSKSLDVAKNLAVRIAEAGAWACVTTDDESEAQKNPGARRKAGGSAPTRLGRSEAWRLENDPADGKQTSPQVIEQIVGEMSWGTPDGTVDHG